MVYSLHGVFPVVYEGKASATTSGLEVVVLPG